MFMTYVLYIKKIIMAFLSKKCFVKVVSDLRRDNGRGIDTSRKQLGDEEISLLEENGISRQTIEDTLHGHPSITALVDAIRHALDFLKDGELTHRVLDMIPHTVTGYEESVQYVADSLKKLFGGLLDNEAAMEEA